MSSTAGTPTTSATRAAWSGSAPRRVVPDAGARDGRSSRCDTREYVSDGSGGPPDRPGACPKCGMALEPVTVSLDDAGNPELDDMMRRFRVSLALTLPILVFMISDVLPAADAARHVPAAMTWTQFALASPIVLWGGWPFFVRGWASVVNRHLNMFTLIALGVGAAFGFSVIATLPELFPPSFRGPRRSGRRLFRAGGGHRHARAWAVLELRACRTSLAIKGLLDLRALDGPSHRRVGRGDRRAARARPRRRSAARDPASGSRSTASCWRAAPASTSRW